MIKAEYDNPVAQAITPDDESPGKIRAGKTDKVRCLKEDVIASVVVVVVLLHVALLAASSFLSAFNAPPLPALPSFQDPTKGFEPRGTDISNRLTTIHLLRRELTTALPGQPTPPSGGRVNRRRRNTMKNCYFTRDRMLLAFASTSGGNLLNARSLKAICHLEDQIVRRNPHFPAYCLRRSDKCCPSFSMGNLVAAVSGKSSCQDITDYDVTMASRQLKFCAPYFIKGLLQLYTCTCDSVNGTIINTCPEVPCACVNKREVIYITMLYLSDNKFLQTPKDRFLKYSATSSPISWRAKKFFRDVYETKLAETLPEYDGVKVVGFDFKRLKYDLFNYYLIENVKYPAIAMAALIIIMFLYLNSIILSFCGLISIIFALVDSYFLYKIVFGIKFFPFLNVTTLIFLVGIGADDAFVYYDIWRQTKAAHPNADCMTLTWKTLRYAALSMFVTSFTTSAAFFANMSSHIISIKCFGIYAGLSVLTNYLMMITWFPAVVLLHERWVRKRTIDQNKGTNDQNSPKDVSQQIVDQHCEHKGSGNSKVTEDARPRPTQTQSLSCRICWGIDFPCHFIPGMKSVFSRVRTKIFESYLPNAVLKFRLYILWIVIFVGLTVGFLCVIFVSPTMTLPTSNEFQLFPSSSTLEQYDMKIKYNFRYAQEKRERYGMNIDIVWGVKATDNGNHFNPDDLGTLEFQDSFDPFSTESQLWLRNFSRALVNHKIYSKAYNHPFTPFENFINSTRMSCLKNFTFPYPRAKYESCYRKHFKRYKYIYFDAKGRAKAMVFDFWTDKGYTPSFQAMDSIWTEISTWAAKELTGAPDGLKDGWAICSYLGFYSLQLELSSGSFTSMGISVAIAFTMMLLTTLNIFISLYAIVTIIGILAITVGTLVLLGWQLNIVESIVLSVAVGLSIDFTMHYGVAYRLSPHKERRDLRVRYSFMHIGSAIFMAAITTFIAGALMMLFSIGALMMPAVVLVYNQLGVFLMLVMFFSYLYSTFAFQSFCAAIGPINDFGQLNISRFCPRKCRNEPEIDSTGDKIHEEMVPVIERSPPSPQPKGKDDDNVEDTEREIFV